MKRQKVLLLNLSHEVLGLISWRDAVKKIFRNVAIKPYGHDDFYKVSTINGHFNLPTVLILSQYKYIPYKKTILNADNLLKRDDFTCQYCGKHINRKTMTMDHVIPISKGGKKNWKNIVASCFGCNNKKSNKSLKDSKMRLKKNPEIPSSLLLDSFEIKKIRNSWKKWIFIKRERYNKVLVKK